MAERMLPRRTTDTVETVLAWTLAMLAVVSAVVAMSIGFAVHSEMDHRAGEQARTRTPITAQLVEATYSIAPAGTSALRVPATVQWSGADGTRRQDEATAEQGQAPGAAVTIWLDSRGDPVGTPVSSSNAVLSALVAGISVAALAWALLAVGWALVRRTTFALNARSWADEWAAVEPQWRRELR
jgi:hypothetical protein